MSVVLAAADLARIISAMLASPEGCKRLFSKPGNVINNANLTFNDVPGSFPFLLDLQAIPVNDSTDLMSRSAPVVSSLSNELKIRGADGIQVQVTSATTANLEVHFDQSNLVRPIKDLKFPITLGTAPAGSNKQIVGCRADEGLPSGVWSPCAVRTESSPGGFTNYPTTITTMYAATDVSNCFIGKRSGGRLVEGSFPPTTNNTVPFLSACKVNVSSPSGPQGGYGFKTTTSVYRCLAGKWILTEIVTDPP